MHKDLGWGKEKEKKIIKGVEKGGVFGLVGENRSWSFNFRMYIYMTEYIEYIQREETKKSLN